MDYKLGLKPPTELHIDKTFHLNSNTIVHDEVGVSLNTHLNPGHFGVQKRELEYTWIVSNIEHHVTSLAPCNTADRVSFRNKLNFVNQEIYFVPWNTASQIAILLVLIKIDNYEKSDMRLNGTHKIMTNTNSK
ncbi:hypothetical protein ElyMa_003648100 [Elysia marginata]|uniref:Uncharacterized protein n=1 Tax=Elysia marginata TaxID=1093978 RepID=A0AAV4EXS5_9GAST|nr:hypothetical protein ElyMa_003648100 [Elysia marginata]